nr:hypothetical protein [Tanacetum cinerariifolium]
MESILEDEDVIDKGAADELKKRKPYDVDKDKGPTAGLDRGLKRQRITNLETDVKELKNVDNSTIVISKIKSEVPNAVKEYLGSSLDHALYKVIQEHSADIIKELYSC